MKIGNIPWYISLLCIAMMAAMYFCWIPTECEPCGSGKVVSEESDSTGGDTAFRLVLDYVPEPKTVHEPKLIPGETDTVRDTMPSEVDTAAIVADYLRTRFYKDTASDSTMRAIIADSVRANRIVSREVAMKNLRPTKIEHKTTVEPRSERVQIMAGGFMHYAKASDQPFRLGPQVGIRSKEGHVYSLGSDLLNEQPNVQLSASFELSFR